VIYITTLLHDAVMQRLPCDGAVLVAGLRSGARLGRGRCLDVRAVVTAVAPGATLITATVSGTKQQFVLDVVAAAPEWVAVVGAR
jgi:hypothetical protein